MELRHLNPLNEQRQHLPCVDGLCTDAGDLAVCIQLLGSQVVLHLAELPSDRSDMAQLEKSVEIAQRQLSDAQ